MERTSAKNGGPKTGQLILSQSLRIGPLTVRYYGLLMVSAIILGYLLGWTRAKIKGWTRSFYDDVCFWLVVCGFLGARIYYVLFYPQFYRGNFWEVFKIWHGGLAVYGAVIGGALALFLLGRKSKKSFFELSDIVVYALPLAQALGRFGNFINYEAFGRPTNLPWKMFVPQQFRPPGYQNFSHFQPTFAYEAIWDILVFAALYWISRKPRQNGTLTGWYLLLYSFGRFFIEAIRLDSAYFGSIGTIHIRGDQLTALALILAGSAIILKNKYAPASH